jgi:hypothetical protein
MAVILIVVGVGVTMRGFEVRAEAARHEPVARPASLTESIERAKSVDQETLPCCAGEEASADEEPAEAAPPSAIEAAIEKAKSIDQSTLPCCAGKEAPAEGGEAEPPAKESSK